MPRPSMDELTTLVAKFRKKLGDDEAILLGSEIKDQVIPRITSGSLSIDVALGGGWPLNQWNEIVGDESHGKTAVVLKSIAANQAIDPGFSVLWMASEEFVPQYAEMLGCDLDRFVIVEDNIMEHVFDIALEALENRAMDCIVIDSLPALVSEREDEGSMEDLQPGQQAFLTGKFFRKASPYIKRSLTQADRPVLGFVINQWREKIGVMKGDPRTTPGGKAKNFYYFVRVEVRRDEWIENTARKRIGQTIKVRNIKNKTAPPGEVGVVDFYFATGKGHVAGEYDSLKDIFTVAVALGVVKRAGAYYRFSGNQWQGQAGLYEAMSNDPELAEAIRIATLDHVARMQAGVEDDDPQPEDEDPTPAPAKKAVAKRVPAKKTSK